MKIIYAVFILVVLLCVVIYDVNSNSDGMVCRGSAAVDRSIKVEKACSLIWEVLSGMGKDSTGRIIVKGYEVINNEDAIVLAGGDDSADGNKFTVVQHFAVSESGKVYSMDILKGGEWMLLDDAGVVERNGSGMDGIDGTYVLSIEGEEDNARLIVKYLGDGLMLFELDMRRDNGARAVSGVINVDDSGDARYTSSDIDAGKFVRLDFKINSNSRKISVEFNGDMSGAEYGVFTYDSDDVSVNAESACRLLESLPAVLTSLNIHNRPYSFRYVKTSGDESFIRERFIIYALNNESGSTVAKFSVADDLSTVYRIDDDMSKPVLIFSAKG